MVMTFTNVNFGVLLTLQLTSFGGLIVISGK